ncbi:MAG: hypothetical protein RLY20_2146 [Verrucomicrobiota bacterium]|jgi:hypothetical protein
MKDHELRAVVLQKYYDLRHRGYFRWDEVGDEIEESFPFKTFGELARICKQLADYNLIEWNPTLGNNGEPVAGGGEITAFGSDVIEGTAKAPITITLDQRHIHIEGSSNVQIGNANVQGVALHIEQILRRIENSDASTEDKANAKSKLNEFLSHPAVTAILGGLASSVKPS